MSTEGDMRCCMHLIHVQTQASIDSTPSVCVGV